MAHDGRDPAGSTRTAVIRTASGGPTPLLSNRGLPARLDTTATTTTATTASFSTTTAAAASETTTSTLTPSSSPSRRGSPLEHREQFRPQSLYLPSQIQGHQSHARAISTGETRTEVLGRARLPRRWTSSSPRPDADDLLRPRATSVAATNSRPSTLQRVTSGIRRLTRTSYPPKPRGEEGDEEDWSVFGEAMVHEGAQPPSMPPPSPLSSSSRAQRSDAGHAYEVLQTQSPVSDDYFPFEVGVEDEEGVEGYHRDGASSLERSLRPSRASARADSDTEMPSSRSSSSKGPSQKDRDRSSLGRGKGRWWQRLSYLPTLSTLHRNILKCSLAYFLGSLFTYYAPLSRFISELTQDVPGEKYPSAMGHMVATVTVYYNPAKTLGGMIEADIYCLMGLAFASLVSLGSMYTYWTLESHSGWDWLADTLVLMWIGVGMSLVAWFKLWIAKPTFGPAASMTSIILFVVVVKEGGLETLLQVALIVGIGAFISNIVCMILWSQSAKKNLQANMIKTLDSFSTLLSLLTGTFLLEDEFYQPSQENISKAIADHQAAFTGLKKNLAEAQSERLCGAPSAGSSRNSGDPYEDAVDSLTRLAQHLNGLRSGTSLQYELAKAHRDGKVAIRRRSTFANVLETELVKGKATTATTTTSDGLGNNVNANTTGSNENVMLRAAAAVFGDLVGELDSPLRALSTTCTRTIGYLRVAFSDQGHTSADAETVLDEFMELANGIQRALFEFDSTSNHAVLRLYQRAEAHGSSSTSHPSTASASASSEYGPNPFLSGGEGEHVFLVYFFIFAMQEFARELILLSVAMSRIYAAERPHASRRWLSRISSALSSVFCCCFRSRVKRSMISDYSRSGGGQQQNDTPASSKQPVRRGLHRRLSGMLTRERSSRIAYSFPKVRPHAPDTVQTPSRVGLSAWRRFKLSLWAFGARLQDHDIKYAVKTGAATTILAAPAFFEATRPKFMEYRGEWALISFFVVMSPTIGGTNFLSVHRVLGTLFGAVTAATAYTLFHKTPAILAAFGFFFSMPCFYYIVAKPQYATTGRFVLLTYNLTCLFSYNTRQLEHSVIDIAFHRSTAVTVGVVWAGFVSRFWWPSEARRELGKQLGEFCLNIGWLYTRLVASNSFSPENPMDIAEPDDPSEETSLLPRRLNNSVEEFMAMELHLQIKLLELQDLLKQTQHEPRLKGPFPIKLYRSILASLQTILDKLHSMRCVTTREEWYTSARRDFIIPVSKERREMVGNIILYFSTLASAFRLKAPLPPYLPPAEKARQQLVEAIRRLEVVRKREIKGSRQLLYFAYALTMKGITQELEFLGRTSQDAFGVIGQSTEVFEDLFRENMIEP